MNDWVNAEQHAERARTFFQNGEWEKALAELRLALTLNPEQSEWHFGMGLTLDALSRYDEAVESFSESLRLRGEDPEVMMHVGIDLIHLGRFDEAIEVLERSNQVDSQFEPGYCYRIAAYAQLGDHDQAEAMFYLARQVHDECPNCCDHLAHSLKARGQLEKAIWCWQQTLRLTPDHADVRANLGEAHWDRGQLERANVLFEQQLTHHPSDADTRLKLGQLQIEMDRHAEAAKTFRSVLDLDPSIAEAHYSLGELAIRCGHLQEAGTEFEMAIRLDAQAIGGHLRLAQVEMHRGRLDRARGLLATELDKPDHTPDEAVDLSRTLMDAGMMTEAIALLSRVIDEEDMAAGLDCPTQGPSAEARATFANVLLHRGYACLVTGHRRAGIADCRRAIRVVPGSALTLHNLALAYLEEGQVRRAAYFHRRAAGLRPKDPMIKRLGHRLRRARLSAWFKNIWTRLTARK